MLSVVMLSVLAPQIIKAAWYISEKLVNIGNSIKVPFYVQNGTAFIKNGATQKISQLILPLKSIYIINVCFNEQKF